MALKRKHLLHSPQANGFFSPKNHSSKVLDWKYDCSCFQGIEQLKKEERRWAKKTKWMNMKAVFGHPFSLGWASPFATPDQGKADPYQYVVWRTLNSIATQTQTTSQHYRPIRSHECLNRKKQHNYSETFFFNASSKMAEHCREKKKSPHGFYFWKDHPFYFSVTEAAFLFFLFKITSLASGFLSAVCLAWLTWRPLSPGHAPLY